MSTTTILLIIVAAIMALAFAVFQYYYKTRYSGKLRIILSFLRFLGVFCLFILLINPKFTKNEYTLEKTHLVVLADNSSSMADVRNDVISVVDEIGKGILEDRFNLDQYRFSDNVQEDDSLSFQGKHTNITKAITSVKEAYGSEDIAVILLTDGNQTIGADYSFQGNSLKFPVYPVVLGDTTRYEDLRIDQVNINKYAFLKNKYPVEIFVSYQGNASVSSNLTISSNGRTVFSKLVSLSESKNTERITTNLDASTVGVKTLRVNLTPLQEERNVSNNQKNVAVEVIDEKTNIAIISEIMHPDIGALTKAIESNEQRSVSLKTPNVALKDIEEVDVFILYQPTSSFNAVYDFIKKKKASVFSVLGPNTDWGFLNRTSNQYRVEDGYPIQEVFGVLNPSFSKFDISNFSVEDFPPLQSDAGPVSFGDGEALLQTRIFGKNTFAPFLFALDNEKGKEVVLLSEGIWKWRMQAYRNTQNFENFDEFIGKIILYLSTNASKNRLNIDYRPIYDGSEDAKITATYFDEAFTIDTEANLSIQISGGEPNLKREFPMLLKGGFYEADLRTLPAGKYSFTVTVKEENRSKSGEFTILDFDVEKQLVTADFQKLNQLATATNGKSYFPNQIDALLSDLNQDERFVPTQKGTENVVSLIDFRILMAMIAIALAIEWFIRKYNGLI